MSGKAEELKGRVKEAAGAITDNNKLRAEGKMDEAVGKAKQVVQKATDAAKNEAIIVIPSAVPPLPCLVIG